MATLQFFRELTLPETLQANAIYLVAPTGSEFVNIFVTGTDAQVVRRSLTEADVAAMIAQASANNSGVNTTNKVEVVTDIAARDALAVNATGNFIVMVQDATGDETVLTGAASYIYVAATQQFTKIAEYESMDFTVNWDNIVGKPEFTQEQLNNLLLNQHTHSNLEVLNELSEGSDGKLNYKGQPVSTVHFDNNPAW